MLGPAQVLLDNQGRVLEVVDFNNPISNDRAAAHGGDVVSAEAGRKSETLFIDTRRFSHSVQAVALVASQFAGTFGSSRVDDLEITVRHLSFVDSSQPSEASMTSFKSRGVLRAHDLFAARLARTPPRPRTPGAELLEEARAPTYRGRAGILRVGPDGALSFERMALSFERTAFQRCKNEQGRPRSPPTPAGTC